jgi:NitT/TauT family transport system substrate-binding protein
MPSSPRSRLVLPLAILLGAALCRPAAAEVAEIRLGSQYGFIYLPLEIAANAGLIAKRAKELGAGDVKATVQRFSGTPAMNEALISGNVDMGAIGLPGALIGWEKTKHTFKALCAMPLTSFTLYSNKPEIKSLADFKDDDRIALPAPNSGQGIFLRMGMEKMFGPGQYTRADKLMVGLPHPDAYAALISGKQITGHFAVPPYSQMEAKQPKLHVVTTSKEILGGFEASGSGVLVSQRFVDANPKLSRAVLLGIEDADRLIKERPREAAEIFIKAESSKLPVEDVVEILTDGSHGWQIEPSGVVALGSFMARTGMLEKAPASWKDVFFPFIHDRQGS